MDQTIIETPDGGFTLAPVVGDEQSRKAPYKRDFVDDNNPLAYDFVIPDSAGNAYARELSDAVLQNYFDAVKDIAAHNKALQENRAAPDAET